MENIIDENLYDIEQGSYGNPMRFFSLVSGK